MRAEFTCISPPRVRARARVRVYASNYAYVTVRVYSLPEYLFTRVYLSGANCRSGLGEPEARVRVYACARVPRCSYKRDHMGYTYVPKY